MRSGGGLARAVVQPRDLADSVSEDEVAALGDAVIPTPVRQFRRDGFSRS